MKEKLIELIEYNYYCNQILIDHITKHWGIIHNKTIELINHILNAQQIWTARINKESEFGVWQINDWNDIAQINQDLHSKTLEIIRHQKLDKSIDYKNSKNEQFSNKVEDIILHIVNHSTYHRAQIATDLKNHGIEALSTDYILYKRNKTE